MVDLLGGQDDGIRFIKARQMQAAQATWDRLRTDDFLHIADQDQLIDRVSERYSLPRRQAE
jgi:hypothetical protein